MHAICDNASLACKCGWRVHHSGRPFSIQCPNCNRRLSYPDEHTPRIGDRIERLLSYMGGNQFKRGYRRIFGRDCNCAGRKHWINDQAERWQRWLIAITQRRHGHAIAGNRQGAAYSARLTPALPRGSDVQTPTKLGSQPLRFVGVYTRRANRDNRFSSSPLEQATPQPNPTSTRTVTP